MRDNRQQQRHPIQLTIRVPRRPQSGFRFGNDRLTISGRVLPWDIE
jgi:hypothetical protein